MMQWISQNANVLQVAINSAMMAVWVIHLHIFVSNMRRQRRPQLLIASGAEGSWFVANLGLEPVYIMDVIVEAETGAETAVLRLNHRPGGRAQDLGDPVLAASNGPLTSGSFASIGYHSDVLRQFEDTGGSPAEVHGVTISVLAETAATDMLTGASRRFRHELQGDGGCFVSDELQTRQIRGRRNVDRLIALTKTHPISC